MRTTILLLGSLAFAGCVTSSSSEPLIQGPGSGPAWDGGATSDETDASPAVSDTGADAAPSVAAPTVTRVSPSSVDARTPGTTVVVEGTGFAAGANVVLGTTELVPTASSPTSLTVAIPDGDALVSAAATLPLSVKNPGGTTSREPITLVVNDAPPPTLTSLSASSLHRGTTARSLELTGAHFTTDAKVALGATSLPVKSRTSTKLVVEVPPVALASAGSTNVVVTVPGPGGGTASLPFAVMCREVLPPITLVDPAAQLGTTDRLSVAVDALHRPYVTWSEYGNGGYAHHVAYYDGTKWVLLGGSIMVGSYTSGSQVSSMALDSTGKPHLVHLLYDSAHGVFDAVVEHWNGTSWDASPPIPRDAGIAMVSIALDAADHPVVAFTEYLALRPFRQVALATLSGGSWTKSTGWQEVPTQQVFNPSVALDGAGKAFVAWDEYTAAGGGSQAVAPYVRNVGAGTDLGSPNTGIDLEPADPYVVVDDAGKPVVAWSDFADQTGGAWSLGVAVHTLGVSGWTQLGGLVPAKHNGAHPQHVLVKNSVTKKLAVSTVYNDTFNAGAHVLDGGAWTPVCGVMSDPSLPSGNAEQLYFTGLAFDAATGQYVLAAGGQGANKIFVERLDP